MIATQIYNMLRVSGNIISSMYGFCKISENEISLVVCIQIDGIINGKYITKFTKCQRGSDDDSDRYIIPNHPNCVPKFDTIFVFGFSVHILYSLRSLSPSGI